MQTHMLGISSQGYAIQAANARGELNDENRLYLYGENYNKTP